MYVDIFSDGGKKSGLLCAVTIMLKKLAVERELSVINTICQVRGRRRNAIQDFVSRHNYMYLCQDLQMVT